MSWPWVVIVLLFMMFVLLSDRAQHRHDEYMTIRVRETNVKANDSGEALANLRDATWEATRFIDDDAIRSYVDYALLDFIRD